MGMGILRAMIAALKTQDVKPRLHPNGFVQLDLSTTKRLHVWHPQVVRLQKTHHPVHDHMFDMRSTVLRGCLRNFVYELVPGTTHNIYRAKAVGNSETVLQFQAGPWALRTVRMDDIEPGEIYRLRFAELHDSAAHGITVTIMEKVKQYKYSPRVAVPVGVLPDNDFRRDTVGAEQLWSIIDGAVK